MKSLLLSRRGLVVLFLSLLFCFMFFVDGLAASYTVSTPEELAGVISALNAGTVQKAVVTLASDLELQDDLRLEKGTLTLLGGGHVIVASRNFSLRGSATLNLGESGYGQTLRWQSSASTQGILNLKDSATLNLHENVTLGPSTAYGQAGAIQADDLSVLNMYGGVIEDCHNPLSVTGAVLLNGNAQFNLYDGIIRNCSGVHGGAVGLAGTRPIGGSSPTTRNVSFYMHGGRIENCEDSWYGGGAVCIYNAVPAEFVMTGGVITGCSSLGGKGYGGAVYVNSTHPHTRAVIDGGSIYGNLGVYGGGIFVEQSGELTVTDRASIHNNAATSAGDDIYSNGTNATVGKVDATAVLDRCGHPVSDWYEDGAGNRWGYQDCSASSTEYLVPFTKTGQLVTDSFALKSAHGLPTATVRFDLNYDDAPPPPPSQAVAFNGYATPPQSPEREGWLFDGWYLGNTLFDFATPVTQDLVLQAHWSRKAATVRFDLNYDDAPPPPPSQAVAFNGYATPPQSPEREGWLFDGWYLGNTLFDFATPVTQDLVLQAHWLPEAAAVPLTGDRHPLILWFAALTFSGLVIVSSIFRFRKKHRLLPDSFDDDHLHG